MAMRPTYVEPSLRRRKHSFKAFSDLLISIVSFCSSAECLQQHTPRTQTRTHKYTQKKRTIPSNVLNDLIQTKLSVSIDNYARPRVFVTLAAG